MTMIAKMMNILKGVALPDDAELVGTRMVSGEPMMVFETPDGQRFIVDPGAGVFPENPDDPHHGKTVQPFYDEGEKSGYHPDAFHEVFDPSEKEESPTTSAIAQMRAEAKERADDGIEQRSKLDKAQHFSSILTYDILKMLSK